MKFVIGIIFVSLCSWAWAQDVTRIVNASPVGTLGDVVPRVITAEIGQERYIIESMTGGFGSMAMLEVQKSKPDGKTLLVTSIGSIVTRRIASNKLTDIQKDFIPIMIIAYTPQILVASSKLNIKTLSELATYSKNNPNVPFGSIGVGSGQHLTGLDMSIILGMTINHIPYKDSSRLLIDLANNDISLAVQSAPSIMGYIQNGKINALAVLSHKRIDSLPDVATSAEQGFAKLQSTLILGLFAPANTSGSILVNIRKKFETAIDKENVKRRYLELGIEQDDMSAQKLSEYINLETAKWNTILTRYNITLTQ